MDNWKKVWDWARKLWGDNSDFSFNRFFNQVASRIAEREGWEEVGSSDVWHASYSCVQSAQENGNIDSRAKLIQFVLDYQCLSAYEVGL